MINAKKLSSNGKITWILIFIIGLILFATSVGPVYLFIQETNLERHINSRYEFRGAIDIYNMGEPGPSIEPSTALMSPIEVNGNIIEVKTEDTGIVAPERIVNKRLEHIMKVKIKINGTEITPMEAWIKPLDKSDSRFLSWLNIVVVRDKKVNLERVAIVQAFPESRTEKSMKKYIGSQKWRIIWIDKDKQTSEEVFTYPERGNHLVGVNLVQISSMTGAYIGYKSDIKTYIPLPPLYPLMYPFMSCIIGLALLIFSVFKYQHHVKRVRPKS
jgi:hypothetical protein